ncbi:TOG array regulator of axonemal microtubules protein 1-like [Epinephelus fuscoguttatus]|uniref:TOG array regulator of axonemal microtubules protein 1-like n=1 Tax=Epinephelus fuscoguttatus TaxID=293821 RepID=UPI0020D0ECDD|nr:TOG array regulator of axonemal microtubules protein 1-like [Epinephelus fuscoguttatus]
MSVRVGGAVKEVADGYKLQSAKTTMEELTRSLQKFQVIHQPKPPAAPRRIPAMAPKVPAPPATVSQPNRRGLCRRTVAEAPKVPAPPATVSQPNRRGLCRRTMAEVPKVPAPPSTSAPPKKKGPRRGTKLCPAKPVSEQEYLQPLSKPTESLSLCFEQLNSDDWEQKLDGCKSVRALAQHHPEILLTKLRQLCLLLTEVMNSPRSAVACAAIDTVAALHLHLGRAMDLEAETTGRTLLLQLAQKSSTFIHQKVNLALGALAEGCSPKRVLSALVNTGLSHRCAAVRGSTAQHLHQLADIIGEDSILTSGQAFAESFLTAVSKMAMDAAPEARHHGKQMLQGLAQQKEFPDLCDRIIPVKDRRPLQKILRMMQ